MGKAIALATPVFFALIAIEWCIARARGMQAYRLNDAINSLSLGVMSQLTNLFVKALTIGLYAWISERIAVTRWPEDAWWTWVLAVAFYDFCYYWNHRLGHESAVFWAAHVVHHQSQCYNLTTALRQTSTSALLSWIFYIPMAIAGVTPAMFAVAAIIDLLYQYWIHTELVGKLGAYDRWFASPSNHRVHHAVNDRYVDRNYGGILIVWDRLFGTFVEEGERCVYGTRTPLNSWDPLWANVEVYADLARKSRRCTRWPDKLRTWWKPPGWQPTAAGMSWQRPSFDVASVRTFDPPLSAATRRFAGLQLTLVIIATVPLLWFASSMSTLELVLGAVALAAVLWLVGAVMQSRLRWRVALGIELVLLGLVASFATVRADSALTPAAPLPVVNDDPHVQSSVERAQTAFLAEQPFDRLQATVLVRDRDIWKHGAVRGGELAYPASVVKLGFLVGAVHWCREQGREPQCLDRYVRPMIVESDNVATGFVVDALSGAPNARIEGVDVEQWIERRRYTEHVLDSAGLLGPQRLFTKTYPTNSGEEPADLERLAWQRIGRNAMTPDLAARLMLSIVSGTIEPQATAYMRSLLHRPRFSAHSPLGGGLPPGTEYENKPGNAFDTLQDVMHARLPDGRELIVAAFSNGWDEHEREPWDIARLNDFTQRLLRELDPGTGSDSQTVVTQPAYTLPDEIRWRWRTRTPGRYEVAAWCDAGPGNASRVIAHIEPGGVYADTELDQTTWGHRWIRLGDFDLPRGKTELVLNRVDSGRLVPVRLRITAWPSAR